jgi:hypothetical protein
MVECPSQVQAADEGKRERSARVESGSFPGLARLYDQSQKPAATTTWPGLADREGRRGDLPNAAWRDVKNSRRPADSGSDRKRCYLSTPGTGSETVILRHGREALLSIDARNRLGDCHPPARTGSAAICRRRGQAGRLSSSGRLAAPLGRRAGHGGLARSLRSGLRRVSPRRRRAAAPTGVRRGTPR